MFFAVFVLYVCLIQFCEAQQFAACDKVFITNTIPGIYYKIYSLDLNGHPPNIPLTVLDKWVSLMYFIGNPIYSGNTNNFNFNIPSNVPKNETSNGKIFGNNITTTNFTFSSASWFLAPKTGWYTFNINVNSNTSAAALLILNYTDAYCCTNVTNNGMAQQFQITSVPSLPAAEHPSGKVYLFQNFKYEIMMSYINMAGNAYLDASYIDPDGYYGDIYRYSYQMNPGNYSEVVTCNYGVANFTTTIPWSGTGTTTLFQQLYRMEPNNFVTIQNWEYIGVPISSSLSSQSISPLMSQELSSLTSLSSEHSLSDNISTSSELESSETNQVSSSTFVSIPNGNFTNAISDTISKTISFSSFDITDSSLFNSIVSSDTSSIDIFSSSSESSTLLSDRSESIIVSSYISSTINDRSPNKTEIRMSESTPNVDSAFETSISSPGTDYSNRIQYGNSTRINIISSDSIVETKSDLSSSAIKIDSSNIATKKSTISSSDYTGSTITSFPIQNSGSNILNFESEVQYVTIITTTVPTIPDKVPEGQIILYMPATDAIEDLVHTYVYSFTSTVCPKCTIFANTRLTGIVLPYDLAAVENGNYLPSNILVTPVNTVTGIVGNGVPSSYKQEINTTQSKQVSSSLSVAGSGGFPSIAAFTSNLNGVPQIAAGIFDAIFSFFITIALLL